MVDSRPTIARVDGWFTAWARLRNPNIAIAPFGRHRNVLGFLTSTRNRPGEYKGITGISGTKETTEITETTIGVPSFIAYGMGTGCCWLRTAKLQRVVRLLSDPRYGWTLAAQWSDGKSAGSVGAKVFVCMVRCTEITISHRNFNHFQS